MTALFSVAVGLMVALALAPGAGATPLWQETGDAGKTTATAQVTTGTGSLTDLSGVLGDDGSDNVDLFKIRASGSDITASGDAGGGFIRLFLFDADGFGVLASEFGTDVTLSAAVIDGAFYYLGIAVDPFMPQDAGNNEIFNFDGSLIASADALDHWTDGIFTDPAFNIGLVNVAFAAAAPDVQVPGPATLILVGSGLLALGAVARRRRP